MTKVIGIRFRKAGKVYYFSPGENEIKTGDHVIVETARGVEYGYVVLGTHEVDDKKVIISGMVCDGAKASCAAKIAEAVDAGIIGYYMAKRGQNFDDGDGIVTAGIEATIRNVGRLAKEGMKETNDEIISIMIGS